MAYKKKIDNKGAKTPVANKQAKPSAKKPEADLSKLSDSNTIEAIVDSKHMKKGKVYAGVGKDTAKVLVLKGLVKLV